MYRFGPYRPPVKTPSTKADVQVSQTKSNDDVGTQLDEAINLHKLGTEGDKEAVKKSYELLKNLHESNPENSLIKAYLGSATSLLGRDETNPNERFKLAMSGLKLMDKAVSDDPDNIEIRILRGNVCFRLPESFFHRTGTAIEDFGYLVSRYEKDSSIFSNDFYCQTLFNLGSAHKNINRVTEAQSTWEKLLSVTTDSKYTNMVRQTGTKMSAKNETYTPPQSYTPNTEKKNLIEGIELHARSFSRNAQDIEKALKFFENEYNKDPNDPMVAAYYANCLSLSGSISKEPTGMFGGAIKANKIFDSAVNLSSDDIEIRLLRGLQSYRLPEAFFKRTATAITDFEYLINRYEKDNSVFSEELYHKILYLLDKSYEKLDMSAEAKTTGEKLLKLSKDRRYRELLTSEQEVHTKDLTGLDKDGLLKEGIRLHDMAVAGKRNADKKALKILGGLYEKYPNDPLVEGYYGSAVALSARNATESTALFESAIKGLKHLKNAVSHDSTNPKLRLLRAHVYYNLPEVFFRTTEKASKDFRFLATAYENNNSALPEETYWESLYHLGMCYKQMNNEDKAQKTWKKLLSLNPDPKYKSLLSSHIEGSDDE